jgi:hypothetical protein
MSRYETDLAVSVISFMSMVILVFLPGKNEYIKKQNESCTVYMNNGPVKNAWSHLRMVSVLYETDLAVSVISFMSSPMGYMRSKSPNLQLFSEMTSSI